MDRRQQPCEILVFAADESARAIVDHVRARAGAPVTTVSQAGELMRRVLRQWPGLLVVCLTPESSPAIDQLLAHFNRLCRGVLVAGVALTHDEAIERFARVAGVTHFMSLDVPSDVDQFDRLLMRINLPPPSIGPPGRQRASPPFSTRSTSTSFKRP